MEKTRITIVAVTCIALFFLTNYLFRYLIGFTGLLASLVIAALIAVCTHLGCTPNWLSSDQKFKCPCHGSGFEKSGINIEGPAPRPLERYRIELASDGQIQIDKNTKFQEEKGQWSMDGAYLYYA